jgi:chromosome partitioning protein
MARSIVATVQRKGGVGKTTIAVCLSGEFYARGKRVTLVDADPQQSSLHWAAPRQLPFVVRDIPFDEERPRRWIKAIAAPSPDDFTIVDTATTEEALRAAVLSARLILLPCTPSGIDIEATIEALYFINCIRVKNRLHVDALLVPNRVDMRTLEGRQFLEVLERLGEDVAPFSATGPLSCGRLRRAMPSTSTRPEAWPTRR